MERSSSLEFDRLRLLLGRSSRDPEVLRAIGGNLGLIERFSYQGWVERKDDGVSFIFKEPPCLPGVAKTSSDNELYLSAIHFYRDGDDGYSQYLGHLPGGVSLGDSRATVISKLGEPVAVGGGGVSTVLRKPVPHWIRYSLESSILQFQLDDETAVEMVTLYIPDPRVSAARSQ